VVADGAGGSGEAVSMGISANISLRHPGAAVDLRSNDVCKSRQGHSKDVLNGQSERSRRETDRGQVATGEKLGSK